MVAKTKERFFGRYFVIYDEEKTYLKRWRIFDNKWFGVYLHKFESSDPDRHFHDHPFNFTSYILWGGYWEHTPSGVGFFLAGQRNKKKAEDCHKVELIGKSCWTLVIRGNRRREWGFHTEDGWVDWQTYERVYQQNNK